MRKSIIFLILSLSLTGITMIIVGPSGKLDGRLFYTSVDARNYLTHLSSPSRERYLISEVLDFWLIANYISLFYLSLKHLHPGKPWVKWLAFPGGVFDLLETSFIVSFLTTSAWHDSYEWLPVLSGMKWFMVLALSFYVIVRKWCMAQH